MILHIRFLGNKPFFEEDKALLKELQELGLYIGFDYEYITILPKTKEKLAIEILDKYKRSYFISGKEG